MSKILDAFKAMHQKNKDKLLCRAIDDKSILGVRHAIKKGADIDSPYIDCNEQSYQTCFEEAVAHSSEAVVYEMLFNNPDLKEKNKDILYVALCHRFSNEDCIPVMRSLIHAGADTSIILHDPTTEEKYMTLLDIVEDSGRVDPNPDARNKLFEIAKFLETYEAKRFSEIETEKKLKTAKPK